ncbi:MAG: DUF624 domain-containing protein [Burkholderiales bacterium]|nr:DUF624 domain-containing protein [Anaerolineae bacterium]
MDIRQRNAEFFDRLDRASSLILANLLWAVLSIPLVTLPAATAGLFATVAPLARGGHAEVFRDFFGGMRLYWKKATVIGLIDVLIGAWIAFNVLIFQRMDIAQPLTLLSQSTTLFVALAALMVNLYLWPLLVTFDQPLRSLLANALRLTFAHPAWSIGMLAVALVLIFLSLFLPSAFLVVGLVSVIAWLICWAAWRVIRRYVAEEERAKLEM